MIVSEKEEEFDFSISNDVSGVVISNAFDILEKIADRMSEPFALIDIELPTNSYRIACTNTQNLKKEKIVHLPSQWNTLLDLI